jgi:hypothetical protein
MYRVRKSQNRGQFSNRIFPNLFGQTIEETEDACHLFMRCTFVSLCPIAPVRGARTTRETAGPVAGSVRCSRLILGKRSRRWRSRNDGPTAKQRSQSNRNRATFRRYLRRSHRRWRVATAQPLAAAIGRSGEMAGGRRDRRPPDVRSGVKALSRVAAAHVEEARVAEAAKTARLRALRLAKEASDRAAAQRVAPTQQRDGAIRPRRADAAR